MVKYLNFNDAFNAYGAGQQANERVFKRKSLKDFATELEGGDYNAAASKLAQMGDVNGALKTRNIPTSDEAGRLGNDFTQLRMDDVGTDNRRADDALNYRKQQGQQSNLRAQMQMQLKQGQARTQLGKLKADMDAGHISPEQYQAAVSKATAPSKGMTINMPGTLRTDLSKSEAAINSLQSGLGNYKKLVSDNGGRAYAPGAQKDALISARRNVQMQAKELFNLGVLNGPDLELMDSMLFDAAPGGLDAAGAFIQDLISDPVKRAESSADQFGAQFEDILQNKRNAYNAPQQAQQQQTQPPQQAQPQPPQQGQTMGGYQFLGGDPSDQNNWRQVQ